MTVLCEGKRGGFFICPACGAGFRSAPKEHTNAFGKTCHGELERVALGHRFITDVVRLQFQPVPAPSENAVHLAFGLAYALVEGAAETLDVPPNDLNATVAHSERFQMALWLPPLVLYDNVPGGAGLVARLEDEAVLRRVLQTACARVSGACGCDANTSCYGCLRSYRNQFLHQHLQRGPVFQYLQMLLTAWG